MLAPDLKPQQKTRGSTPLSFAQAINGALGQAMELDPNVFVCGIGADTPSGIFGTTPGLVDGFGAKRVFDTPIAEAGITALAAGAGNAGLRPVVVHQRLAFMMYFADQVVNWVGAGAAIGG